MPANSIPGHKKSKLKADLDCQYKVQNNMSSSSFASKVVYKVLQNKVCLWNPNDLRNNKVHIRQNLNFSMFWSPMACVKNNNILAAFQGMHVLPVKQRYGWLPRKFDYRTDRQTPYKVIPMCCYASQATQKSGLPWLVLRIIKSSLPCHV